MPNRRNRLFRRSSTVRSRISAALRARAPRAVRRARSAASSIPTLEESIGHGLLRPLLALLHELRRDFAGYGHSEGLAVSRRAQAFRGDSYGVFACMSEGMRHLHAIRARAIAEFPVARE